MSDGTLLSLCTSERKGVPKTPVRIARLLAGHGIEGDAHAGDWHRQVSLLASSDFEQTLEQIPDLTYGAFAENMVIRGIDLSAIGLGSKIALGPEAILEISQLGKECHTPCRIGRVTGSCILPARGLFARVVEGGEVSVGDPARVIHLVHRARLQAVVITVSDRCHAGQTEDTAGPAVCETMSSSLGAHIYRLEVVPDERDVIEARLRHYCDGHSIDLVLTVGGTGMSTRDVTPEATRAVVERLVPGLDEAMRLASARVTPHALLSRGVSGVRGRTLVVNLPGSRKAAVENLGAIIAALPHGIDKLRGSTADCSDSR
jgi:molybdenum cofactor synthesis domain-containing protein